MAQYDRDVAKLARLLRFYPVRNEHPRTLARKDLEQFNTRGFLTGFRVYTGAETRTNRENFDAILSLFQKQGKDSYAIDRYQDRFTAIYDIATWPKILDIVEDLIGPNIICWATHYFCKMPGDDKGVSWHQDCSYWPLTPSKTVTVWLAIDDADRENGCMRVIPGSHLAGHLDWHESDASENNVLTQTIEGAEKFGEPVDVESKAGEISLHSDLLVHGSLPNRSKRRRCGLTLRYCPPEVRTYWGWSSKSILCRGEDPTAHWANVKRPEEEREFKVQS